MITMGCVLQCMLTGRRLTKLECSAIALVCMGVILATVTDSSVTTNILGVVLSIAAILFSAVYQVLALMCCCTYPDGQH
jgi:drug/metabolite transporter (DMT)-like permease